jgi:hypothetical protein
MGSLRNSLPEESQGTMGSQKRPSLRKVVEQWVPQKGTPRTRSGNHGFSIKELYKGV